MASVGFHLQHLRGLEDRLFTYARNESLTETKLSQLQAEGKRSRAMVGSLLGEFNLKIDIAIGQLKETKVDEFILPRGIGRKQILTNVLGLLFHAAKHTMRHRG